MINFSNVKGEFKHSSGFEVIPDGCYKMTIESAKFKSFANGSHNLDCKFKILDGPYANRIIFDKILYFVPEGAPAKMVNWAKTNSEALVAIFESNGLNKLAFNAPTDEEFAAKISSAHLTFYAGVNHRYDDYYEEVKNYISGFDKEPYDVKKSKKVDAPIKNTAPSVDSNEQIPF